MRILSWVLTASLVGACTFDSSGLEDKRECLFDDECPTGLVCRDEGCVPVSIQLDLGFDLADISVFDSSVADTSIADTQIASDSSEGDAIVSTPDCEEGTHNECGGCDPLVARPGDVCGIGECGLGSWRCAGANAIECVSVEINLNACGGCGALLDRPGDPCGTCGAFVCEEGTVVCRDPIYQACGGCGVLDGDPETACGICGGGTYTCTDDALAVVCDNAEASNACGGCGVLAGTPNLACGACLDGIWQCSEDGNSVDCVDETPANICGGCGDLEDEPDDPCGDCTDGSLQCNADGGLSCIGASETNACGGCTSLIGTPLTDCGVCLDGQWQCNEAKTVDCVDATPANACDGCGDLDTAEPEDPCGCGGALSCNVAKTALDCVGGTPENACGGCEALANDRNSTCGTCLLDIYECVSENLTECDGDTTRNRCGGCITIEASLEKDEPCGRCDLDAYVCVDGNPNLTECDGNSYGNECFGCAALPDIGTRCVCNDASRGEADWACDGTEAASCSDDNETPATATSVGTGTETDSFNATAWVDGTLDREWFSLSVTDNRAIGHRFHPQAAVTSTAGTAGATYEVCVFFRATANSQHPPYSCVVTGARCVWYDASADSVKDGNCQAQAGFTGANDYYGCCNTTASSGTVTVQMSGVDDSGDQAGTAYAMIRATGTSSADSCDPFSLTFSLPE